MHRILVLSLWILLALTSRSFAVARVALDSSSLSYGSVAVSSYKDVTLRITDTSNATVQVDQITSSASDYTIVSPTFPAIIAAGSSIDVVIRFTPKLDGTRTTLLTIETDDGPLHLLASGIGTTENSHLSFSDTVVDFGYIAPFYAQDTSLELYSLGPDSATIDGIGAGDGSSDTTFEAVFVGNPQIPFKLAPGDSIQIRLTMSGLLPTGPKQGLLSIIGAKNPSVVISGDIEWGSVVFNPVSIDFGTVNPGDVRDTTINLTNTGLDDILIDELNPPYDEFSLVDTPATPFVLHTGESRTLAVRANPGLGSFHQSDIGVISSNTNGLPKAFFSLTIGSLSLHAPDNQPVNYFCAEPGAINFIVPISNTGDSRFIVSKIAATDVSVLVESDIALPDTITAGSSQTFQLRVSPGKRTSDTLLLQFFGGTQPIARDSLFILGQASSASASLAMLPSGDSLHSSFDVRTHTPLSQFMLDTLLVRLDVNDENAVSLDTNSLMLASGLTNAHIASIQRITNGYDVTIVSSIPIIAPAGSSILSFSMQRFVSTADSASVRVLFQSPERTGCIDWTGDTMAIPLLAVCGSDEILSEMAGTPLLFGIRMLANPIGGNTAHFLVNSGAAANVEYEISNALGQCAERIGGSLAIGQNDIELPLTIVPGPYFLRISCPDIRATQSVYFIKQ